MSNTNPVNVKVKNISGAPLPLSFAHSEICARLPKCACTNFGAGGTVHLSVNEEREIDQAYLNAAQFKAAIASRALRVERPKDAAGKAEKSASTPNAPQTVPESAPEPEPEPQEKPEPKGKTSKKARR